MSVQCCGRCEHFTLVDAPRAAAGEGRCTIYGPTNPEPLVRWDHRPTVLFSPVRNRMASDKRNAWIQQMQRKESADGVTNATPDESAGPPARRTDRAATSPPTHV